MAFPVNRGVLGATRGSDLVGYMNRNPTSTFSLRFFLVFCVGIAILCGCRQFLFAGVIFLAMLLHYVLLMIGSAIAKKFPQDRNPFLRRPRERRPPNFNVPITVITCQLVIFIICPVYLSGSPLQEWGLILTHVFIYVTYLSNCYGTGHVCRSECGTTACGSVLLLGFQIFPMAMRQIW